MKKFSIIGSVLFLCSCASTYIPQANVENAAHLTLPSKESSWRFFGGFSSASVAFGIADSNGCGKFYRAIPPAKKGDENVTVDIPPSSTVFVGFFANNGNWMCDVKGYFLAKPNSQYKVLKAGGGFACQIAVGELSPEGKYVPIELGGLDTNSLTGSVCVKHNE